MFSGQMLQLCLIFGSSHVQMRLNINGNTTNTKLNKTLLSQLIASLLLHCTLHAWLPSFSHFLLSSNYFFFFVYVEECWLLFVVFRKFVYFLYPNRYYLFYYYPIKNYHLYYRILYYCYIIIGINLARLLVRFCKIRSNQYSLLLISAFELAVVIRQ